MTNDYTDAKYYADLDTIDLTPEEEEELMGDMYAIGMKPDDIIIPKDRKLYEEYIKNRVEAKKD